MKKLTKKLGILSLATLGAISVASCGTTPAPTDSTATGSNPVESGSKESGSKESGSDEGTSGDKPTSESEESTDSVTKTLTVSDSYNYHANVQNKDVTVVAEGVRKTYSNADYTKRTEILGLLERYAVENGLTGLTLYGDGAVRKYNERLQSPTSWKYVPGYGFGVFKEGRATAPLSGEKNDAFKMYYHTATADAITTVNPLNVTESTVSDYASYTDGTAAIKRLNETSTGYEWVGDLVEPEVGPHNIAIAVNPNADNKTKEYKFKVRVGADLKYATLTGKDSLKKYNGKEAELEDYLTVAKLVYAKSVGYARATDTFNTSQEILGAQEYYAATGAATTWEELNEAYEKTLKKGLFIDDDGYLHIVYKQEQNNFYGMYYAPFYQPVPESFITDLAKLAKGETVVDGSKVWAAVNKDNDLTPVDTVLSTGAYAWETWSDTMYTLKRVETHDYDGLYNFEGVHIALDTSMKSDTEAAWKKYESNLIDSCAVPSTKLAEHRGDVDAHMEDDETTYKINMNTCTEELWEELFGENGTIVQTPKADYWDVKPAMSNKNFTTGLSYALDRKTFATTYGRSASGNFFGNGYYSDPENGIVYNTTDAHKNAVASVRENGSDEYGFSLTLAQQHFTAAAKELVESGANKAGDTIKISIGWQTADQASKQGATLKEMFEKAFNESDAKRVYGLTLEIENIGAVVWSDVYYNMMMVGQFDLCFGSISGNPMNPINFLEVLKSDNSSGFTLNWGSDTNTVDPKMVYDGMAWSFDALWTAADTSALVKDGKLVDYVDTKLESSVYDAATGTRTTKIKYAAWTTDDARATFLNADGTIKEGYISAVAYDCNGNKVNLDASQFAVKDGYIVITLTKEQEDYTVQLNVNIYFDVEVKTGDTWNVVDEGKTSVHNSLEVLTATVK